MVVQRNQRAAPSAANDAWTMDFVADQLADGTKLRALTVVDVFTREALAIEVGQRLKGEDVVRTLDRILQVRAKPKYLFVDNGSEFSGRMLDLWAYRHKVRIDFSRPGKPTDNGHVETFNGSLRDECLNVHWFASMAEARASIEAWRQDYNESRPHMAHGYASPGEFARKSRHLADRPSAKGAED
jgi:putative transposase